MKISIQIQDILLQSRKLEDIEIHKLVNLINEFNLHPTIRMIPTAYWKDAKIKITEGI